MKTQVCDISGMGGRELGGYEWGCQAVAAKLERVDAEARKPADAALALIREHGWGANSPDLEDALRQLLQSAITHKDNSDRLEEK